MAYKPEERQENNRERQQGRKRMQDTAHRAFEKNTKRRLTAVGDWQRGEADGTGNRAAMAPVFLGFHGWGSDERDFLPVCRYLASGHDYASLRAPVPMSALFADEGYHVPGYSWFTQVTVSGKELDRQAAIDACLIERWCEENLEDDRKIVPLGFSQGGMMVTQLLRTIPERVAGAIVFSGFHAPGLLDGTHPADGTLEERKLSGAGIPVFFGYGSSDTLIGQEELSATAQWLENHSDVDVRVYPGMEHEVGPRELRDVLQWIEDQGLR